MDSYRRASCLETLQDWIRLMNLLTPLRTEDNLEVRDALAILLSRELQISH